MPNVNASEEREQDRTHSGRRAEGKLMKMVMMSQEVTRKKQAEHCRKEAAHAGNSGNSNNSVKKSEQSSSADT